MPVIVIVGLVIAALAIANKNKTTVTVAPTTTMLPKVTSGLRVVGIVAGQPGTGTPVSVHGGGEQAPTFISPPGGKDTSDTTASSTAAAASAAYSNWYSQWKAGLGTLGPIGNLLP